MDKPRGKEASRQLVKFVVEGIQEKKGKEIVSLNLTKIENAVCDYFVICHGDSNTQVKAIANSIEKHVKECKGEKPWHTEGYANSEWVLIDYVTVVVHVFQKRVRNYYNLEELWADARIAKLGEALEPVKQETS